MSTDLGGTIREARRARGWSQEELAQRAEVSRPTVARIEGGHAVAMSTLVKVAAALGLHVDISVQREQEA